MGRKRKAKQSDSKLTSIALNLVKEQVSQKRNKRKKTQPEDIDKRSSDGETGRYDTVKIKKHKSDRCSDKNGEKTGKPSSSTQGFFGVSVEKDITGKPGSKEDTQEESKGEQGSSVKEEETSEIRKELETEDTEVHGKDTFQRSRESKSGQESLVTDEEPSHTPKKFETGVGHDEDTVRASRESENEQESSIKDEETSDTPKQSETEDNEVYVEDYFQPSRESGSEQERSVKDEETSYTHKQSETEDNEVHNEGTFQASKESESEQESSVKEEETEDNRKQPEKDNEVHTDNFEHHMEWDTFEEKFMSGNEFEAEYSQIHMGAEKTNSFKIMLNDDEWKKIKPNPENPKKLQRGWTDMFANKFNLILPSCALSFKYHNISTKKTPKGDYLNSKAVCKQKECGEFKFVLRKKPSEDQLFVVITVFVLKPIIPHLFGEIKKRNLKGALRNEVKEELEKSTPSKWHYTKLGEMSEDEAANRNHTKCQSKEVLRKAKSEWRLHDVLHQDPFTETVLTKQILEEQDDESSRIKGYIQEISYQPLIIAMYTEKSVEAAKLCIKNGTGVFYLDATGCVVAKLPGSRQIFYYAMVVSGVEKGDPPVPVLEFLSDHHGSFYIVRPLLSFFSTLRKLSPSFYRPTRIESDFSWAIIHSILLSVNSMSVENYLKYCYEVVTGVEKTLEVPVTIIHLCSSHMLKAVKNNFKDKVGDKKMRELLLRCFALLQNCTALEQTTTLWRLMCVVFGNKYMSEEVIEAEETLRKHILKASVEELDENLICDNAAEENEHNLLRQSGIRKSSPFYPVYNNILLASGDNENSSETETENPLYRKDILTIFQTNYLPLICLWSGFMLAFVDEKQRRPQDERMKRDTNSTVENWMKIVKVDTLEKEKRLRMGLFIRKMNIVLKGRLREYVLNWQTGTKKFTLQDKVPKPKSDPESAHTAQEKWERRESGKKRTSFFYSPPKSFPSPKKPKKSKTKASGQASTRRVQLKSSGIQNRGNTCWLISTLQSFASFEDWSLQGDDVVLNLTNQAVSKLKNANEHTEEISIDNLKDAIDDEIDDLCIGVQHDSAVYVEYLMRKAQEEGQQTATEVCSVLQCIPCGNSKSTIESFNIIPSEIPMRPVASTADCLQEFFKQEVLQAENKVQCSNCKQKSNHTKHYEIKMANAQCIVIQVKRYKATDKAGLVKSSTPVLVSRLLALGEVRQRIYRLVAVQKNCYLLFYQQMEVSIPYIEGKVEKGWNNSYVQSLLKANDDDLLSVHCNERVTTLDFRRLQTHGWLNDKIVNLYFKLLGRECPNVCIMDTFFYTAVVQKHGPDRFLKPDTFLKDLVLIPAEYNHHWILMVVNVDSMTIEVMDSGSTATPCGNILRDFLEQSDAGLSRLNVEEFQDLPKQQNSNDCGVFMCQFGVCRAFKKHVNFTQEHIQQYRNAMLVECMAGRLMPRF